ncbi:hypothetical protein ACQKP7_07430 [Pseudomonas frederiksbergensis]|uniref:hypothetical protein n=1 Tax=Pseudomonas frederiksbergensis TaxID=104087 RepID=UPI003CFEFB98
MPELKNFVAVDWRSGPDQIYFFFKDTNTYSRFDIGESRVPLDYPRPVTSNWGEFNNARNLRFGFTTTGFDTDRIDGDILWLFDYYTYDGSAIPSVRKYDQDTDTLISYEPLEKTRWKVLAPYFNNIVAGTWWEQEGRAHLFRFLLNDGRALRFDYDYNRLTEETINEKTWPGLARYKDRIITAAQNDRTARDNYLYIFLTNHEYLRYNMDDNELDSGPIKVDDVSWPGLLRG